MSYKEIGMEGSVEKAPHCNIPEDDREASIWIEELVAVFRKALIDGATKIFL
jgi:hypothetical protein